MVIKLGSNIASLNAQRRLAEAGSELSNVFERLSSGQRINRASDDSAGLAIADDLKAKGRIYGQAIRNGNDGISLLNIADSAIDALTSVVIRIRELSEQSANGSYSSKQREAIDAEAQQLSKEFTRITQTTTFNSMKIFSEGSNITLQLGDGVNSTLNASIGGAVGTGSFGNSAIYTAETTTSRSVTLADLNSDGILDMITAGTSGSTGVATVRLGLGDGSFSEAAAYSFTGTPSGNNSLTVTDLNGDGIADLAIAGGNRANILFGTGDGSFGSVITYTMDSNSSVSIAAADLNGDGIVDLITGGNSMSTGTVSIRFGTGNGLFGNVNTFSSGHSSTNELTVGDLNNDGIMDLVTGGSGGKAHVRLGNGDGTFGSLTAYSAGTISVLSIVLEDLNDDGILDMLTASNVGTLKSTVRLGNGDGTFAADTVYSTGITTTREVVLGDINGDGILDLAFAGYSGSVGEISVLLGTGGGKFGTATVSSTGGSKNFSIALGDLNGDGVLDIASAGETTAGRAMVLMANTKEGLGSLLEFSLKNRQSSLQAMKMLDNSIQNLSRQRGAIGASQSRINIALNNLQSARENFSAAESRIRDADIAQESASLIKAQILQQAASSVLAQANQSPALALKLLT